MVSAILFSILKIIGIVLLFLLIIILLVVLVLFFSPINYWVSGAKDANGFKYYIYVTWLFNMFKLSFDESGLRWRLLWLSSENGQGGQESEEAYASLDNDGTEGSQGQKTADVANEDDAATEPLSDSVDMEMHEDESEEKKPLDCEDTIDKPQPDEDNERKRQKKSKEKKRKHEKEFDEEEPNILERIKAVWNHPDRDAIWQYTKELFRKLVKQLKPRKFHLEAVFGFDNPADTGIALAAIYAVLGACNLSGDIEGDFLEERLEFAADIEGRTNLWLLTWPIVIYIFKKPVWKIVKQIF